MGSLTPPVLTLPNLLPTLGAIYLGGMAAAMYVLIALDPLCGSLIAIVHVGFMEPHVFKFTSISGIIKMMGCF
jgi:hypothetical protein